MKYLFCLLFTFCGVIYSATSTPLVLVQDGKAQAAIVVPDDADSWTKMAAGWVKDYVAQVSGADLAIVEESKAPQTALISVGHTKLAAAAGLKTDDLKYDGCKMVVKGNVLYLVGRDVKSMAYDATPKPTRDPWDYLPNSLRGNSDYAMLGAKGTCRAATLFLEETCGIRWLVPTPEGTYIPQKTTISVAEATDRTFEPWMMYHSNRDIYGDPRSEPAAYANNYRLAIKLYTAGGHTYPRWVPTEAYFKDHPEYFVLLNGKRTGVGNHLCASNKEVREIIRKAIQSNFDAGYDLVQLGQSDGYIPCECDECRKLSNVSGAKDAHGQLINEFPGEPMHDLARWAAEQLVDKYPGKYIHLLVYADTSRPPKKFQQYPKNVVCEYAGSASPELISQWEGRTVTGGTVYAPWHWVDFGVGIGVKMSYLEAAETMRYFKQTGIVGIHNGGGQCWGLQGPTYYVFGKMMGNPDLDPKALLKEYCQGLYGSAANEMIAFFNRLHEQSDKQFVLSGRTSSELLLLYYPPTRLQVLDELLRRAEAAAKTEREKNWVKMSRDEFDYIRLTTEALYLYRAYQINKTPADLAQLQRAVEAFDKYRTRVVNYDGQYELHWFPGHSELCNVLTSGQSGAGYGGDWREARKSVNLNDLAGTSIGLVPCSIDKPFTLNFKSKDLETSFHIRYTKNAPKIDGKTDEPEWQQATPAVMGGAAKTHVRGLYDNENLYVAFTCQEPRKEGPHGVDIVRDNPICFMDVVELFLDPDDTIEASRYYHFLAGATANAIQDLREGFEGAGSQDKSWSAAGFRYGFTKDVEKQTWTIEMLVPFKDIITKAPSGGDVWLGNLAREGGSAGLQQWSKGGTPGFCNPKSFGRIVFDGPKSLAAK